MSFRLWECSSRLKEWRCLRRTSSLGSGGYKKEEGNIGRAACDILLGAFIEKERRDDFAYGNGGSRSRGFGRGAARKALAADASAKYRRAVLGSSLAAWFSGRAGVGSAPMPVPEISAAALVRAMEARTALIGCPKARRGVCLETGKG